MSLALAQLAIRRQAPKLSQDDYVVYVADLMPYEMADIEAVCLQVGRAERQDVETSFPTIGRLLGLVKREAAARRDAEIEREFQAEAERARKSIAAGDGEYVGLGFLAEIIQKRNVMR